MATKENNINNNEITQKDFESINHLESLDDLNDFNIYDPPKEEDKKTSTTQEILKTYLETKSARKTAEKHNISHQTVLNHIKKTGENPKKIRKLLTEEERIEAKRLYIDEHLTLRDVGNVFKVGTEKIRNILRKQGVKIRNSGPARRKKRWIDRMNQKNQ